MMWLVGSSMIKIDGFCKVRHASDMRPFCPSDSVLTIWCTVLPLETGVGNTAGQHTQPTLA